MNQPHGMMPFPMMLGFPPQMPNQEQNFFDRIPARVLVAIKYIDNIHRYEQLQVVGAACDVSVDFKDIPGVKPDVTQLAARDAACNLLKDYFNGEYKPQDWEKPEPEKMQSLLRCPACSGQGHVNKKQCDLCEGLGGLRAVPAAG